MIDGELRRVVMFPDDGHPDLCATALDLTGDPRDEIVLWDVDRVWIYTQDRPFEGTKIYAPLRNPHCNDRVARSEQEMRNPARWPFARLPVAALLNKREFREPLIRGSRT
jgi:hypothetical protein